MERLHEFGGRMIASIEPKYPRGLAALDPPPPLISVIGHETLLAREMVGIVGARNASALGCKLAARLAADLGEAGFAIVSGLARGIDAAAHDAALAHGTCAVVAGGIDIIYPPEMPRSTSASVRKARSSPRCRSASGRRRATSRGATG